jgi:hypothetical protein
VPHATVYLEQEEYDRLGILADTPEEFDALPEPVKVLIRLFFMWEESDV